MSISIQVLLFILLQKICPLIRSICSAVWLNNTFEFTAKFINTKERYRLQTGGDERRGYPSKEIPCRIIIIIIIIISKKETNEQNNTQVDKQSETPML